MNSSAQRSLELFDDIGPAIIAPRPVREANPFRKKYGSCAAACDAIAADPARNLRIFWCHMCRRSFCWNCLKEHKD